MKSIKPGRGPSAMSFVGSIFATVFGIFWTIIAFSITANTPLGNVSFIGIIFPLFGVIFVISGIIQALYHLKNATGKNRFSTFDITDSTEEKDPLNKWINNKNEEINENDKEQNDENKKYSFCPYCGQSVEGNFTYCTKCGKSLYN